MTRFFAPHTSIAIGTSASDSAGYGPSGLPDMGTFGEVARTTMVRNAFRALTGDHWPTPLVAFSDQSFCVYPYNKT
mgnify:CR=1 FL=1